MTAVELFNLRAFDAEWVLWFLVGMSVFSIGIILERFAFFARRRIHVETVRNHLRTYLENNDLESASGYIERVDSFQSRVVWQGLVEYHKGADAVEEVFRGAEHLEHIRFSRGLGILATIGSNAPFIGLLGTVIGIIHAFRELAVSDGQASTAVMSGISEALIATAVGLVVAIPAVIAFNALQGELQNLRSQTASLTSVVLSHLKERKG